MAVSVSKIAGPFVPGSGRHVVLDVTFDNSYVTGGEPLTPSDFGLSYVSWAIAVIKVAGAGSVVTAAYDVPNQKLKAFTATGEVANATDLSAVTATVYAAGK